LACEHLADAIAERAYRSKKRLVTEADFIIIGTAIAVVGVVLVSVIVNAPGRRGKQSRPEPH
jgi:hypothetical protein